MTSREIMIAGEMGSFARVDKLSEFRIGEYYRTPNGKIYFYHSNKPKVEIMLVLKDDIPAGQKSLIWKEEAWWRAKMSKVFIKGIPWEYETGGFATFPKEGEYLHLPNEKYLKILSDSTPYEVVRVERADIPEGAKIHRLLEPGTVGFDRNGPIVKR